MNPLSNHPKVGIRPTIDARQGGVRESLEVQTMNMAKNVAGLLSSTLKYTDGTPVQGVILKKSYLYDLPTKAGKTYSFSALN
jgi:L-fucose isomerase